jgi:predicted lipoprotein
MQRSTRRRFLQGLGGVTAATLVTACTRATPSDARAAALTATSERVLLPAIQEIVASSRALVSAIAPLRTTPNADQLTAARSAWRQACLAWQRGQAFQHGPLVTTGALLRAAFWPTRPSAIAELVQSPTPIDPEQVAALGVDVKGLFALEHLLFEAPRTGAVWVVGEQSARATQLAAALADDIVLHATRVDRAVGASAPFTAEYAAGGQQNVDRLVNQLLATTEAAAARLTRVLTLHQAQRLRSVDVQAAPSGLSSDVLKAWLSVNARIYAAADTDGLATLVRSAAPALHTSIERAFASATHSLGQLSEPLERIVVQSPAPLTAALRDIKALEVALRAELASALGVALTFASADGD